MYASSRSGWRRFHPERRTLPIPEAIHHTAERKVVDTESVLGREQGRRKRETGRQGPPGFFLYRRSEGIARAHLDQARGIDGAVDLTEGRCPYADERGLPERRMVEYVEKLSAELEGMPFMERETLHDREVPVLLVRSAEGIARRISKSGRR